MLHFTPDELAERRARACEAMAAARLDGLLIFRQESMYYLTGYDSFGYVFFQCLYLGADGSFFLITRAPDLRQAALTSCIDEIHIWVDRPEAKPERELITLLTDKGARGGRLGVEYNAYGLTGALAKQLDSALAGFCHTIDASLLISRLRVIKSASEIAYVRRAAELADAAYDAAIAETRAGAFEGDILAAMHSAIFRGDGDYPGNEFIIGSGPEALLCRYHSGRRHLDPQDQLTLEWAGAFRHYHAALMRTLVIGQAPPRQREMHSVAQDALLAVEEALAPGNPVGMAFDAHARVLDAANYQAHRLNACGYSLGTTFAPNWMDWPMLYQDNPVLLEPGMVFFVHIIIFDSDAGLAMTLGRTSLITAAGAEPLSRAPLDLIER